MNRAPPPPVPPSRRSTVIQPGTLASVTQQLTGGGQGGHSQNASSISIHPPPPPPIPGTGTGPGAAGSGSAPKAPAPSPPPKPSALSSPIPPRKPISLSAVGIATIAATSLSNASTPPIPAARPPVHNHNNYNNASSSLQSTSPSNHHLSHSATSPSSIAAVAAAVHNGFQHTPSAPNSSANSPSTFSPSSFSSTNTYMPHVRSQTTPSSQLRPSGSSTFTPAPPSIPKTFLHHQKEDEEANPFSDPSNEPSSLSSPSPVFVPRPQSSLLTARLQSSAPSLQAPVPHYGGSIGAGPTGGGPGGGDPSQRSYMGSPPPPVPALPPRTRSPLAGHPASQPIATPRPNTFQRHSSIQPLPPPQSLAMSSPSQPVPPPPRRSSVQLAPTTPQPLQQPRGPSPMFSSPAETNARFRNLTAPQHAYDQISPQTPKRLFSSSSSTPTPYNPATSPTPERGIAQMDLSDSQSDSDETSDDSDKEYDDVEEYQQSLPSNPFSHFVGASPRPIRSKTFAEPAPPSLPSRPPVKAPPRPDDVAPALPPKPSIRRRPPQETGTHLAIGGNFIESESDSGRIFSTQPVGVTGSASDGVFPDYSRSNRRLPLFSDVMGIHDIHQKSHGVRAFSISNEQVATATSNIRIYSLFTGENISSYGHEKDTKPTALLFTQSRRPEALGQYLWAGWSEGSLQVVDTRTREVVEKRRAAHKGGSVSHIIRCKNQVWTLDDTGSIFIWAEDTMLGRCTLQSPLQSLTTQPKQVCAIAVLDMMWSSEGAKIHIIRVGPDAGRPKMPPTSLDIPFGIGPVTCLATIAGSGQVFSGHEDGKVIIWSIESREKVRIVNVHAYRIMSLLGVGSYLWAGFATGKIYVLDLRPEVPVVMKDWQAHKDSGVAMMQLDEEGLILGSRHQIGSCAENGEIKVWDGLMAKDRLTKGMVDRSKEYCQWRDLKVLICSWNIDASKPAAQDVNGGSDRRLFEAWLTSMDQEGPPDIISVGFQEIVDLESKKMTAKSLLKGSKRAETETISKQYKRWQIYLTNKIRELYAPMGVNFKLLECSNLVGLFSCVFVRDQEWVNVRSDWTHVDMVKTGLKGYHGNKGGIATRLIIDDTSISFVNCHLAAGQSHTRQRNTDAANILKKLCHPNPVMSSHIVHPEVFWFGDGTMAMDHEICFLSGDLNYRIDVKFSDAVQHVQSQDWNYLHQHDQLLLQKLRNPQFYDPGTDTYDTSSKHRTPAWCDRILWRGRHVRQLFYKRNECRVSDHRPISGGFVVAVKKIDEAQRQIVEQQVKEGWFKVQEKEIRIKKLAWLRSWGWTDTKVEGILDREGGELAKVVRILSAE
ncbi:hypothetical protein BGZ93_003736 [Podila epicladia]|nr:hypothetical protein BGZ93_003736 [Podila epicladia]